MQVKDHTFLITGAASGLGAATAERLVAGGARVMLCDLNDSVNTHAQTLGKALRHVWLTLPQQSKCSRRLMRRLRLEASEGFRGYTLRRRGERGQAGRPGG